MATATVAGANGQTVTLTFDTQANAVIAQNLTAAITAGVDAGTIIAADSKNGPPPPLPPGKTGEWIQSAPGSTTLPPGYLDIVNSSPTDPTITGTGATGQSVLSTGLSDLTFIDVGGTGTVVAGGGDNRIVLTSSSSPSHPPAGWLVNTGNGDDNIITTNGKSDTINPGGGQNALQIGNGDLVQSTGDDTVLASGKGSETITATGQHSLLVHGQASNIFVSDVGSATIFGGTGSDTFFGGQGPDLVHGGTGGNNDLHAGTGPATLFGGGDGDQLFAAGSESAPGTSSQVLHAGVGNETLFGGFGSGDNTFFAGSGSDQITGGTGNDTFNAATGNATITGGTGDSLFVFTNKLAGGQDLIKDFTSGADTVSLVGYGSNEIANAVATQTHGASTTVTLTDNTKITFTGVDNIKATDFSSSP